MTGIFDSIIDSITDFDTATLGNAAKAAATAYGSSKTTAQAGATSLDTQTSVPASRGSAITSVSPEDLETVWYNRLNSFAKMQQGVK